MVKSPFLIIIIMLSVVAIAVFPIYTVFLQNPQFTQLFRNNTIDEATNFAEQVSDLLMTAQDELSQASLSPQFIRQLERLQKDSKFIKLIVFNPEGVIIYSADETEIGTVNKEPYFKTLIETGNILTKEVDAGALSMDKKRLAVDAVEIYVPIKRINRIVGVLELYYDITAQKQKLTNLIYRSYGILFGLGLVLLIAVVTVSVRAARHLKERELAEQRLQYLSVSDEMTGLYNRRGFYTLAQQQKKISDRTGRGMMLVMADLNGLKEINDNYGHEAGDRVLIEAAEVLRESFRESDIIGRLGGDEFAVLMPEQPNISQDLLTNRMNDQVNEINGRRQRDYSLSISVGFARYNPQAPVTIDELAAQADARMYEHKRRFKQSRRTSPR